MVNFFEFFFVERIEEMCVRLSEFIIDKQRLANYTIECEDLFREHVKKFYRTFTKLDHLDTLLDVSFFFIRKSRDVYT